MTNIRHLTLAALTIAMLVVWTVVLPWTATHPMVENWIRPLREKRINPSAMYYTEVIDAD